MENSRETHNETKFVTPKRILRTAGNVTRQNEVSSFTFRNDDSEDKAEVIFDYGRCEGGFPIFTIESASAPDGQKHVAFQVTYSETIEGIDNENGIVTSVKFSLVCQC